jgi:hypothetical protein
MLCRLHALAVVLIVRSCCSRTCPPRTRHGSADLAQKVLVFLFGPTAFEEK